MPERKRFFSIDVFPKHLTVQALTITFTSITCYIFTTSYIFSIHHSFFTGSTWVTIKLSTGENTFWKWQIIDFCFSIFHRVKVQLLLYVMTRQVVFARHKIDEKKTLGSFTRGQKVAKCGTLTAKNTSTCSVAMDPTSLVTGTRWRTLRSRISRSEWTHPPWKTSRARRRTRAGGWARGGGADGAERHSYWTWHCYGWGVKTTWTWEEMSFAFFQWDLWFQLAEKLVDITPGADWAIFAKVR